VRHAGLALLVLCSGFCPAARAAAELRWTVPAGCGDGAALERKVSELLGEPLAQLSALSIEGVIREQSPGQFRLWLQMRLPPAGSPQSVRELEAADCQELFEAAALAISLAVTNSEQRVSTAEPRVPAAAPAFDPESPRPAQTKASAPVDAEASFVLGAAALLDVGAFPQAAWGSELELAWQQRWLRISAQGGWLPPQRQRLADGSNQAEFALAFAAVSLCGRAQLGVLQGAACGGFEMGRLSAQAVDIALPKHASTAWRALEARLAIMWPFAAHIALLGSLGLSVPLTRAQFVLDGSRPEQRASLLCLRSLLGVEIAL
jgi:hypothetical protein